GLGLSICHRIVTDLGGEISFESRGTGTTFRVTLPPGRKVAAALTPSRTRTGGTRRKVLVVDDERTITSARARVLSDHEARTENASPVVVKLIASGERYDAIVCDFAMPVMSGRELYEHLLDVAPDQARRMIVMTGAISSEAEAFFTDAGLVHVTKPFDLD